MPLDKIIPPSAGAKNKPASAPTLEDPLVATMLRALESERGLIEECGTPEHAEGLRFQYYKKRQTLRSKGNRAFDDLIFKIDGSELLIIPGPKTQIREIK